MWLLTFKLNKFKRRSLVALFTLSVLHSNVWLVATMLDGTDRGHFYHYRHSIGNHCSEKVIVKLSRDCRGGQKRSERITGNHKNNPVEGLQQQKCEWKDETLAR